MKVLLTGEHETDDQALLGVVSDRLDMECVPRIDEPIRIDGVWFRVVEVLWYAGRNMETQAALRLRHLKNGP